MKLHIFNCRKKPNKPSAYKISNTNAYILSAVTFRYDKSDQNFKVNQNKLEWVIYQEIKLRKGQFRKRYSLLKIQNTY